MVADEIRCFRAGIWEHIRQYEISDPVTKKVTEKGYYVRVWKRDLTTVNLVLDTRIHYRAGS